MDTTAALTGVFVVTLLIVAFFLTARSNTRLRRLHTCALSGVWYATPEFCGAAGLDFMTLYMGAPDADDKCACAIVAVSDKAPVEDLVTTAAVDVGADGNVNICLTDQPKTFSDRLTGVVDTCGRLTLSDDGKVIARMFRNSEMSDETATLETAPDSDSI